MTAPACAHEWGGEAFPAPPAVVKNTGRKYLDTAWTDLSGEWARVLRIAERRRKESRGWGDRTGEHVFLADEKGVMGEIVYERASGLSLTEASTYGRPDFRDGTEVRAVDVGYDSDPWLKVTLKARQIHPIYCMTVADPAGKRARIAFCVSRRVLEGMMPTDPGGKGAPAYVVRPHLALVLVPPDECRICGAAKEAPPAFRHDPGPVSDREAKEIVARLRSINERFKVKP